MTGGAWLPAVSVTPSWIGTYTASTYANPIKTASTAITGVAVNALTFTEEADPTLRIPGDLGDLTFFSTYVGPYFGVAKYTVPFAAIQEEYLMF
jgi:hypothetical protein